MISQNISGFQLTDGPGALEQTLTQKIRTIVFTFRERLATSDQLDRHVHHRAVTFEAVVEGGAGYVDVDLRGGIALVNAIENGPQALGADFCRRDSKLQEGRARGVADHRTREVVDANVVNRRAYQLQVTVLRLGPCLSEVIDELLRVGAQKNRVKGKAVGIGIPALGGLQVALVLAGSRNRRLVRTDAYFRSFRGEEDARTSRVTRSLPVPCKLRS